MHPHEHHESGQLLRVAEACRRLAVGRSTFYELVAAGRLKLRKVGSASRIVEAELDAYIANLPAASVAARIRR